MREDSPSLFSILNKSSNHKGLIIFIFLLSNFSIQAQNIEWDKTLGGYKGESMTSLVQTMDGGYILGGYSSSDVSGLKSEMSRGGDDYWIVKIDESGNKQWDKTFGGNSNDHLTVIQQTPDRGYILAGYSNSILSGDKSEPRYDLEYDYWVIRLDESGNKIWDRTLGGNGLESPWAILQSGDGGYIIAGSSTSGISGDRSQPLIGSTPGMADYWLIKIDQNGNKLWDRSYGSTGGDFLKDIQQTNDGGLILAGNSFSNAGGDKSQNCRGGDDYWVIKVDVNGVREWDRTYGGADREVLKNIHQTSDGGYILGGTSFSSRSGEKTEVHRGGMNDFWAVKITSEGDIEWDRTIGGNGNEELASIKQTSDSGYILGGYSYSGISGEKSKTNYGSADYWLIKLSPTGRKDWDHALVGNKQDHLSNLILAKDGSFILGGHSFSDKFGDKSEASIGSSDFWMAKLWGKISCEVSKPIVQAPELNCTDVPFSISLTAQGENIRWYADSDLKTLVAEGNMYQPEITSKTTFFVTQSVQGCESEPQILEVHYKLKPPKLELQDLTFCAGEKPVLYTQGQNIKWYEDANLTKQIAVGNNFIPILDGRSTFYVTQTIEGCESDAAKVRIHMNESLPSPTVNNPFICDGTLLAPLLAQGTQISWYRDEALTIKIGEGNSYFPAKAVSGRVYVTQQINGCESIATRVDILEGNYDFRKEFIANIITPNGDGKNDFFSKPVLTEDSCIGKFKDIIILNRWGKAVFESNQPEFRWNASGSADGIYFYLISYENYTYKGSITVNR